MARVPEVLMARFRAAAMLRLERIDKAWAALVRGEASADTDAEMLRDVHTLKGDAKVVGLVDASLLVQRLEDLLGAARERRYSVHDDVDIVVTMAIQFLGMLVRKESSGRGGIDIDGFMKQVEQVMVDWLRRSSDAPPRGLPVGPHLRVRDHERVATSASLMLAAATTKVFVEQLRSTGEARTRVRECWTSLLDAASAVSRTPLNPLLASNATMARELAVDLGKRVEVRITGGEIAVTPETSEVIGILVVHALRNAIDHGIELPSVRTHAGKHPAGIIRIAVSRDGDRIKVSISDDGAGIDLERARTRAVERGLLSPDVAAQTTLEQISDALFLPGFTTRDSLTPISGRGIGLNAGHAAVTGHGGTLRIERGSTGGLKLLCEVPDIRGTVEVVTFEGSRSGTRFAVPAVAVRETTTTPDAVLEDLLEIPAGAEKAEKALEISWDDKTVVIGGQHKRAPQRAWRRCPTADTELVEVVWMDDSEVLLVRPAVLRAQLDEMRAKQ
jgi:chemotaxis protein histidine kinase CheA